MLFNYTYPSHERGVYTRGGAIWPICVVTKPLNSAYYSLIHARLLSYLWFIYSHVSFTLLQLITFLYKLSFVLAWPVYKKWVLNNYVDSCCIYRFWTICFFLHCFTFFNFKLFSHFQTDQHVTTLVLPHEHVCCLSVKTNNITIMFFHLFWFSRHLLFPCR